MPTASYMLFHPVVCVHRVRFRVQQSRPAQQENITLHRRFLSSIPSFVGDDDGDDDNVR